MAAYQRLANALATAFNATMTEQGMPFRGGWHQLDLPTPAPTLEETKAKIRQAMKATGFRAQKGHFGEPDDSHGDDTPCFYVIRGSYRNGTLGVIELMGTPEAPRMTVMFGG